MNILPHLSLNIHIVVLICFLQFVIIFHLFCLAIDRQNCDIGECLSFYIDVVIAFSFFVSIMLLTAGAVIEFIWLLRV